VIVAAHQPHYLPWLGYLDKLAKADVFVVMDDLQYETQNYQNRQRVKINAGATWLTVPLHRGSQGDAILDKRIDNSGSARQHWQHRTWRTLEIHYGKTPFFKQYGEELREVYTRPWERLIDVNMKMLELARKWFDITVPITRASTLGLTGQKSERLIDMCKKLGAKVYLSGNGGSAGYLDEPAFKDAGIGVMWQRFTHPTYPQRYPHVGFVSHLGFLDVLFNCGPEARQILWGRAQEVSR
jgi:WbqC-like protein